MTLPAPFHAIPAVCLQSHPSCCPVCTTQWMACTVIGTTTPVPVRCPQCTSTVDLLEALGRAEVGR